MSSLRSRVLLALAVLPAAAGAQTPSADATGFRAARFAYDVVVSRDGHSQPLGNQTISFSEVSLAGRPAWLILEARDGGGILGLDSLVLSRDDLSPMHWGSINGQARLAAAFARDSVYGATASPLGKRSIVGPAPRGVIASEGMLDGLLQLWPLDATWTSDAALLVADLSGTRLLAARLAVEREEDVTVPAGTFAAWVVVVRIDGTEKRLWVSKDDRMVVKSSQTIVQLGATLERELTRVDDLTLLPEPPAVPLPGEARIKPPAGSE